MLLPQLRDKLLDRAPARLPYDVRDEQQLHDNTVTPERPRASRFPHTVDAVQPDAGCLTKSSYLAQSALRRISRQPIPNRARLRIMRLHLQHP